MTNSASGAGEEQANIFYMSVPLSHYHSVPVLQPTDTAMYLYYEIEKPDPGLTKR